MPPDRRALTGINDSKKLSAKQREKLIARILANAVAVGIGAASVREIDRLNILQASVLAVHRALRRLAVAPNHVVVDGRTVRTYDFPHTAVVRGDSRCHSIACASIVAKITRDRVMHALSARYPQYRWENNVGYATANHLQGIAAHGITPHHRRSFLPVSQLSLQFDDVASPPVEGVALDALVQHVTLDVDRPVELQ